MRSIRTSTWQINHKVFYKHLAVLGGSVVAHFCGFEALAGFLVGIVLGGMDDVLRT